ncbi:MAG: aspartate carbamoyltransferase catalytic subunit [Chloroflexi bacterium]|nr:aspartate carbamoyltransferase catalytic subunit [Chloroflexota bacterium]
MTIAQKALETPRSFRPVPGDTVQRRRHVLDLDDYTREEIEQTLETAEAMAEVLDRRIRKVPTLRGRTLITLFYEPSTRTRASFEQAGKIMSADVINITGSGSSIEKGESLIDTVRTLEAMGADAIIIRHSMSGAPYVVAKHTDISVINAGDGWHAHPSQALLDLYTVRQRFQRLDGLKVVIVGDLLHSRVARSNVWGLRTMGANVVLCGPPTLLPSEALEAFGSGTGATLAVETNLDHAIEGADVVMALRIQKERQEGGLLPSLREYVRYYQVNEERIARAKPSAMVMHPGPMNEGIEISHGLANSAKSMIHDQVRNGVAVRMALLYLLAAPGEEA